MEAGSRPFRASSCRGRLHGEVFFAQPRPALAFGASLLVLFLTLGVFVPMHPLEFERRWLEWMREIRGPVLDHLALAFDWLGHGIGRALVLAAVAVPLLVRRRWAAALAFGVAELLTPLLGDSVKAIVDRPRPPDGLVHPGGASFPSGHAAFAAMTMVAVALLFSKRSSRRRVRWALAGLVIVAMAWSRTYLHVHWLLDVVGGSMLGAGIALGTFAAAQILVPRQRTEPARQQRGSSTGEPPEELDQEELQ